MSAEDPALAAVLSLHRRQDSSWEVSVMTIPADDIERIRFVSKNEEIRGGGRSH